VNPESTCYYRAMKQAKFQTLLILDAKTEHSGPATAFKRVWCGYEMSMTLGQVDQGTIPILDVATVEGTRPTLVTQGLTKAEENMEFTEAGSGYKAKAEREKGCNPDVIDLALGFQVQSGQTLRQKDRDRILNSIAGRELMLEPDIKHEIYNKYNSRLRSLLALSFWRRVMSGTGENSETGQLQTRMCQALKADQWLTSLDISMAYMVGNDMDEKIGQTVKHLPPNLKHLTLDLTGTDISDDTISAMALALPRGLETFKVNLTGNPKINNIGVETMVTKMPPTLQRVNLGLAGTAVTKEVDDVKNSLDDLKAHIVAESEKGSWCTYVNLTWSKQNARMVTSNHKFKHYGHHDGSK